MLKGGEVFGSGDPIVDRKFGQGYSKDYPVLTAAVLEAIAIFSAADDVAREIAASDQL